jgi:hypothetical protein
LNSIPWEPKNDSVNRGEEMITYVIEMTLVVYVPQLIALHMDRGCYRSQFHPRLGNRIEEHMASIKYEGM